MLVWKKKYEACGKAKTPLQKGAATGIGNPIYYVGAMTGRDGLGGASFASKELTEESHQDDQVIGIDRFI